MEYTIVDMSVKTTRAGEIKNLTLRDEQGVTEEGVAIFHGKFPGYAGLKVGDTVVGSIIVQEKNGYINKYLNAPRGQSSTGGAPRGSGGGASRQQGMREGLEKKMDGMAYGNATNNAVQIVLRMPNIATMTNADVQSQIKTWREWFLSESQAHEAKDYEEKHNAF